MTPDTSPLDNSTLGEAIYGNQNKRQIIGGDKLSRIFAAMLNDFMKTYNKVAHPFKLKLFKELNETKWEGKARILEIGGGSGANFQYYTVPCTVDIIEPNPHFVPYFEENRQKYTSLEINDMKQGYGEDLSAAGIADDSVDAVVMSLVLCSVEDQRKCIKEIQRVLKPGGKFFYIEHIIAEEGETTRMVQKLLMQGGFWPSIEDGCCLDRDTFRTMEQVGGWSRLEQTRFDLPAPQDNFLFKLERYLLRPHVMGVAVK